MQIKIGATELAASHNIKQVVEVMSGHEKRKFLLKHLDEIAQTNGKVLIFVGTKRTADEMTRFLRQECVPPCPPSQAPVAEADPWLRASISGWPALAIHGDKEQRERDWVLEGASGPLLRATCIGRTVFLTHALYPRVPRRPVSDHGGH